MRTDKAKSDLVKVDLSNLAQISMLTEEELEIVSVAIFIHDLLARGKMSFSIFSLRCHLFGKMRGSADRACLCFMRFSAFISQRPEATGGERK